MTECATLNVSRQASTSAEGFPVVERDKLWTTTVTRPAWSPEHREGPEWARKVSSQNQRGTVPARKRERE